MASMGKASFAVPPRLPIWTLGLTVGFSALLTIYGGIRAFYFQGPFLAPIAYTTDERPTAKLYAELLGVSPESLLTGIHAFFDFLNPYYWGSLANPWIEGGQVLPVNYPPVAMMFMKVWTFLPYKTALMIYLAIMAIALVLPMIIALRKTRWSLIVIAASITLMSGPAIASLDRGNTQGFLPILLFGFGMMVMKKRWGWAAVFLVAAASLKLFPAILLALFISERRWRALTGSIIALIIINTAGFAFYPGNALHSFQTWFAYAFTFLGRDSLSGFLEYNTSFIGGLAHWCVFLGLPSAAPLVESVALPLAIIILLALLVIVFQRKRIPMEVRLFAAFMSTTVVLPVAYPYSANWVIAGAALLFASAAPQLATGHVSTVIKHPAGDRSLRSLFRRPQIWMWSGVTIASALLLTFAPVFIPGTMESGYRAGVSTLLVPIAVSAFLIGAYRQILARPRPLDLSNGVKVR